MESIIDNKKNTVGNILLDNIQAGSKISVISSYFTIFAFDKLKGQLKNIEEFRFLFLDPTFTKEPEETKEFFIQRNTREKTIGGSEFEIKIKNELNQNSIAKECADWIQSKANFKSINKSNYTDAKAIIIENQQKNCVIEGTLDFDSSGLGFTHSSKRQLNVYSDNYQTTKDLLGWFDDIWNDEKLTQDVTEEVIKNITFLYKENSPELLYYFTLYNLFKDFLEEVNEDSIIKSKTNFKETLVWNKLYKFQKDGVIGCIDKLEKYNGCILADSVGLGKTFEALAVIKYYELRNHRVLVLAPKKLRDNWSMYRDNDKRNILANDRFAYDVLNHTDMNRYTGMSGGINLETINWGNYDLVVIDESHNFRNNEAVKGKTTRYQRLMNDIIKSGVKTKVLMLSATPINNRMNDLKNQIGFITEGKDSHLMNDGITSIAMTIKKAQTVFNEWLKLPEPQRTLNALLNSFDISYFKLLDIFTIARSRKHIKKYYDISDIGKFPERLKPKNIKSNIDIKGEFPELAEINRYIGRLNLSVYSLLAYVRIDQKQKYDEMYNISVRGGQSVFKQIDRERSLINLMRVNILKRLESSIHSFKLTLNNVLKQVDITLKSIDDFESNRDSLTKIDIDFDSIDRDSLENDEELESIVTGNKVKVLMQDMDLVRWRQDLNNDRDYLLDMIGYAGKVNPERDAKLKDIKDLISKKINQPINDNNKKIVIFTSFADTAMYLYVNISHWVQENYHLESALVTGSGTNKTTTKTIGTDLNSILIHFSPISKEKAKIYPDVKEGIDILIATDCISEGQNLQDCDYLVNYDIHWNPVRIIQRFGRIDRIGSINDRIQLVNFWPNLEIDEYINLEQRVRGRMVLLDTSATGEDNIINEDASKDMNDLQYRKKQLEKIQSEVVDIEDLGGGVSITDLTLNDFKMDLVEYAKEHKDILEKTPTGIYAITHLDDSIRDKASPGVIFTLKQKNDSTTQSKYQNATHPYYIVYITNDGEVKYNYIQAKTSLDIYKKLCTGYKDIVMDLVQLFNKETKDGKKMGFYSELLEETISNIIGEKQTSDLSTLFDTGVSSLGDNKIAGLDDFELITFLIIK